MKKGLFLLGVGAGIAAAAVVHAYLDVMYKETIPQSLVKKVANHASEKDMEQFKEYTAENKKWVDEQDIENIDLLSDRGYTVRGYFLPAKEESKTFVVFAHGYRADHNGDPINFERYYHEKGFNFLSVDHTTAGDSEGDYVGFGYFESMDMLQWLDYLVERFGEDISIIVHGVSMGGATVCQMADKVPGQVKLIVSDCAFTSAYDQFDRVARSVGVPRTKEVLSLFNAMNRYFAKYDLEQTNVRPSLIGAKVPMLFVHGGADGFVPTDMVYELYDLCPTEKDLLIVEGAGHAQSIMVGTDLYKAKLDEFIGKYL